MNVYEKFIAKQNEIVDLINKQSNAQNELTEIKREIYKKHIERFKAKPLGKSTIKDAGYEIVYNRTEKISLLKSVIEKDEFQSSCIEEKVTPEKRSLSFSKSEYKKLSDDEQSRVNNYITKEMAAPTISVKVIDEK